MDWVEFCFLCLITHCTQCSIWDHLNFFSPFSILFYYFIHSPLFASHHSSNAICLTSHFGWYGFFLNWAHERAVFFSTSQYNFTWDLTWVFRLSVQFFHNRSIEKKRIPFFFVKLTFHQCICEGYCLPLATLSRWLSSTLMSINVRECFLVIGDRWSLDHITSISHTLTSHSGMPMPSY